MKKSNIILIVVLVLIVLIGIGSLIYINQNPSNKCAKEGEFFGGYPSPNQEEFIDCCEGLTSFYPWGGRTDGPSLCFDSKKGLPECKFADTDNEGWYYSGTNEIIKKMACNGVSVFVGGCAGVYMDYWDECCENWAVENNISRVQCIGNWTVENNTCVWKCSSEIQCKVAQDCYPEGFSPGTDGGLFYRCIGGKCYEGSSQRSATD